MFAWHEIVAFVFARKKNANQINQAVHIAQFDDAIIAIFIYKTFFPHIDILYSVLGLPSECSHNNVIRSCTLSFSCWIQGGRHAGGCGENTYKWLFSCCVPETEIEFNSIAHNGPVKSSYFENDLPSRFNAMTKIKAQMKQTTPVKQNMLRRRMDDDGMVILNFLHFRWIFFSSH